MDEREDYLGLESVPDYLMSGTDEFDPVPLSKRAVTFENIRALLKKVQEQPPYGWDTEPVHPDVKAYYQRRVLGETHEQMADVFEDARRDGETRAQAKTRIMLEAYSLEGGQIRDSDLWRLRAQYVHMRQYVQGSGGGLPYNTNNPLHFVNRYARGGAREAVYTVGLRKDTVEEMGRAGIMESQAREALRLMGHWQRR